ncbi:MAG: hypothetical protein ABI867_13105 [Kofleriaceae bacterium]
MARFRHAFIPIVILAATGSARAGELPENQLSFDVESSLSATGVGASVSYAHRIAPTVAVGAGGGIAWEESQATFENVYVPMHGEAFVRWGGSGSLYVEGGVTAVRYGEADDETACCNLIGGYVTGVMSLHRYIALAARVRVGLAHHRDDARDLESITTPLMVRMSVPW